jgi:hypothetical protein
MSYRGGLGVNPPPPTTTFRSFEKAEPNSQFRGKYIPNNVIRTRISLICKLSGTPDYVGCNPQIVILSALSSTEFVNPTHPNKIPGYATDCRNTLSILQKPACLCSTDQLLLSFLRPTFTSQAIITFKYSFFPH